MADLDSPDAIITAVALGRLEKPSTDEYIIAFGPSGRQFFATPNGYSAVQLPLKVLGDISSGVAQQVTWASFGSQPDSWFFAYELTNSTCIQIGPGIPAALHQFIDKIKPFPHLYSALRVQLGEDESFVAWSMTSWVSYGIPEALEAELRRTSWTHMRSNTVTRGSSKSELRQIAWHSDGSYYIKHQHGSKWHFESITTRQAWDRLWYESPTTKELSELVYVALDPHAPVGETFAFIKKQHDAQEAPFVFHFYEEPMYTTIDTSSAPAVQDTLLQHIERKPEEAKYFRWAISKRTSRPHRGESRELELEKGQRVKVWEDRGRDWYIVEGRKGVRGWAHGSWLEFCGSKVHSDPQGTYIQFQEDMRKLLVPGQLREFPRLREYMSVCTNAACAPLRNNAQVGICVHDLKTLLEGSGCYSYEWLKDERNVWHPDKFARYCRAECKQQLKACAQEVFVLYGVLMDMCRQEDSQ